MSINAQPFNPTFKLIGNLVEDQVLTYDSSENAFVNSTNTGGGAGAGFDAAVNTGTGLGVWSGSAGTTLQFKTLLGGADISITDNGDALVISSTVTETIQTGTNLGTGTGIYDSKDATTHQLKFKSIVAGTGLTLTDDGAGTLTLVNDIAAGTADADLTLSNLSNVVTARTNLGVYSKAEGDAKYHKHDDAFVPSANNTFDIGSATLKYNDIYAETFQGIAVLADQLTISGTTGQVLTHNGSVWVAGAGSSILSSASDMSNVAPNDGQHLTWNATTNLWTPSAAGAGGGGYQDSDARNSISVSGDLSYNAVTGVISYTTPSDTDTTYTAGSGLSLTGTVFANTSPDQTVALTGAGATSITGTYPNFTITSTDTNTDTTYTNVSEFTNDSGYLTSVPAQAFSSLSGVQNATASEDNMVLYYDHGTTSFKWKAGGTPSGYNNTNWDTAFGWGNHASAGYLTSTTAHYTDSDVNTHLNTGTATANQALVWTGTDYDWVTSTDSDTTYTAGSGLTLAGTVFSNTSPDQTVVLTGTGATSITGTYPNFTITSTDTNTDTDTTYTAGSGLTLTGTAFSLTAAHFDGAFSSLSGVAAVTASDDDKVLYYDHSTTSFKWKAGGTPSGYNNTNWDTAFGWGNHATAGYLTSQTDSQTLSLSGTTLTISTGNNVDLGALTIDDFADVNITAVSDGQFLTYDNGAGDWTNSTVTIPTLTSQLTNDAGFLTSETAHYNNSDVDTHLNQSNPTSGYVLSWNGSDYAWISNGASGAHFTTADARSSISGTTGLSYNSTTGVMTLNASVNDLLDVNGTPTNGQVLKWNGTTWAPAIDLVLTSTDQLAQGSINEYYTAAKVDAVISGKTTSDLTEGTNKYFTDARARASISVAGDLSYTASTGVISYTASAHYDDADVNTHLNVSGANANEVLEWTGSDYAWVANTGVDWTADQGATNIHPGNYIDTDTTYTPGANVAISGANVISATDTNTTYVSSDFTHDDLTGFVANEHIDWTQSGAGTIHASNYTDTNTTYTNVSEFTNDSGYLISSDLSGYALTSSLATVATTGNYSDLSGAYANSDVDSHLNKTGSTGTGEILSWNGSDYSWITNSGGGGATDKIEDGDSSVEVIDGGANGHIMFNTNASDRWQVTNGGHILPEANATYDIGSASNKVRHLYLSDTSLYIGSDTLRTNSNNLLFNGDDIQDYDNLKNTPILVAGGTGIQVNAGVVSLNSTLSGLTDVATTAPATGEVLKWTGSAWAPGTDLTSGSSAMNDLSDVDTTGITTGQYLKWDGSAFVASTVSSGGASAINDLSDVDTTTSAPSNGDVLTWVQADSEWAPATPAAGGGSGGTTVEMFKLNYATNSDLSTITNTTSGVSATILSTTGGNVEVSFTGHNYPPSSILIYGYVWGTNEYKIEPFNKDMTTRTVSGGGTTGSPTAFGSMSTVDLTLNLARSNTGATPGFGTVTHAWIMFTMV